MIIRTSVPLKENGIKKEKETVVKEVNVSKKKNKKSIPTPVIEEIPVVVEEENIDLSDWLKEDIDN